MLAKATRGMMPSLSGVNVQSDFLHQILGVSYIYIYIYIFNLVYRALSLLVSGYEWREVPVDGYIRRKRVGIPCEVFQVASKYRSLLITLLPISITG